ncbi:MAG: dual specificity protein phosphatase family protein [Pirellulales bacterium]
MLREIEPRRLYLGNAATLRDLDSLFANQIAAVLDLALNEPPARLAREMIYCRIPIDDGAGNGPERISAALRCLVALVEGNFPVLVACSAGMSRSPALAAAALAIVTKTSPDDCLAKIAKDAPCDVSPALWADVKRAYNRLMA